MKEKMPDLILAFGKPGKGGSKKEVMQEEKSPYDAACMDATDDSLSHKERHLALKEAIQLAIEDYMDSQEEEVVEEEPVEEDLEEEY